MKNRIIAVLIVASAGCAGNGEPGATSDQSKPAVVQTPAVILPSDTAKPDTSAALGQRTSQASHLMAIGYGFVSTGMVFMDAKVAGSVFEPTATFITPELRATGSEPIGRALAGLGRRMGVKEMKRGTLGMRFLPDSVVADSGIYTIVAQREGQAATRQSGAYATMWRMKPLGTDWLIMQDRLYPPKPDKKTAR
jgi:hypothetical protein